jgi:hypothetical protein
LRGGARVAAGEYGGGVRRFVVVEDVILRFG